LTKIVKTLYNECMNWRNEDGKSLLRLANVFMTILVLGQLVHLVIEEIKIIWWLLVIGIISTIILYFSGSLFIRKAELEIKSQEEIKNLIYD
jgi:uncharacterized membrane protein